MTIVKYFRHTLLFSEENLELIPDHECSRYFNIRDFHGTNSDGCGILQNNDFYILKQTTNIENYGISSSYFNKYNEFEPNILNNIREPIDKKLAHFIQEKIDKGLCNSEPLIIIDSLELKEYFLELEKKWVEIFSLYKKEYEDKEETDFDQKRIDLLIEDVADVFDIQEKSTVKLGWFGKKTTKTKSIA